MQRVRLGRTGLNVSVACLGTGGHSRLGQAYGVSFEDAVNLINLALENDINFIDTAGSYGTEQIIGQAIRGKRSSVIISTKSHVIQQPQYFPNSDLITNKNLIRNVEHSLTLLGTEYVDILYLQGVMLEEYNYCVDELLPTLDYLKQQGKILYTAISERFYVDTKHDMLQLAVRDGYFDVIMVGLNVVNQTAMRFVLPMAKEMDMGTQCMYAVRGKLARRASARTLIQEAISIGEVDPADIEVSDPLGFLVEPGVADSVVEACYRFDRHAPGIDAVLTGTGRPEHLLNNISAMNRGPLPTSVLDRVKRAFGRVESVSGD